jgi:serine/threonine-protein kinase RIO1
MKSFVIGTCCFHYYEGTDILDNLKAAQTLQAATKDAIVRDTRLYGALTTVQDRRKQWRRARRQAMSLLTKYRKEHVDWLPKELFDLAQTAIRVPRDYKRTAYALRWYANQTLMINSLIKDAEMVLLYRSI